MGIDRKVHPFKETAVSNLSPVWVTWSLLKAKLCTYSDGAPVFWGVLISYPIRGLWPKHCHRAQWDPVSPTLPVLFASMATHDGVQFWKKRKGVCSLFWRVTGDEESHGRKEFSPLALSKTRCWKLVTQVLIHALVSSCFRSSRAAVRRAGNEVNNNLPLNKQRGRGGRRRGCSPALQWAAGRKIRVFSTCIHLAHSSDLAGSSQEHEETFVLRFFLHGWAAWKICLLFRFEYTLTLKEK